VIEPWYVRQMARYNAWQHKQLYPILDDMGEAELRKEQGAFFGSIFGTLNHLLWGDTMWMSRFDPSVAKPDVSIKDSSAYLSTLGEWNAARFQMDGAITQWAQRIKALDLQSDLSFYSGVMGREVQKPLGLCVAHFFNHQTHHRGQVHAMLTAAGQKAPVSDLFLMPEDV